MERGTEGWRRMKQMKKESRQMSYGQIDLLMGRETD